MEKDNIQNLLLQIGRKMVQEKGTEALTVRKLSEASGCSVGAIYNQFANMENFIVIQNYMTLDELSGLLAQVKITENAFGDLNKLLQVFVDYVSDNKNLWFLLYSSHLRNDRTYSYFYMKKVVKIVSMINGFICRIVPEMERPESVVSAHVLWLTLFALSAFLTKDILDSFKKVNKKTICQLVLNTYMAGLTVLEKNNG
ncbi:MAG: TetR/AcrR family transcriptional regulator [Alphaproteobacteria bacterium]|nr:TetR/AcrR family transcriptional regulator [Alphaproteobacteria bacterium]